MMKIDFEDLFSNIALDGSEKQKKLNIDSIVSVYFGINTDGCYRLAFLSSIVPPKIESTKMMSVVQGEESPGVFWTCFDLLRQDACSAYFSFCQNMVDSIDTCSSEDEAMKRIKKRYICWKNLFKNEKRESLSKETIQGLYGELFFMDSYLSNEYGVRESVLGWGGPDRTSKDFGVNSDWFEVKTIGATSATVTISSISQLSSDVDGHLVVIKVERMPSEYSNGRSSVIELLSSLLERINDEAIEDVLLSKIERYGVSLTNEEMCLKFDVKAVESYLVNSAFPRITNNNIPYSEITNVSYDISLAGIGSFLEVPQ